LESKGKWGQRAVAGEKKLNEEKKGNADLNAALMPIKVVFCLLLKGREEEPERSRRLRKGRGDVLHKTEGLSLGNTSGRRTLGGGLAGEKGERYVRSVVAGFSAVGKRRRRIFVKR